MYLYLLMHAVKQKQKQNKKLYQLSLTPQNTGDKPIKRNEFSCISFWSMFGWPYCFGTVLRQHTTVGAQSKSAEAWLCINYYMLHKTTNFSGCAFS